MLIDRWQVKIFPWVFFLGIDSCIGFSTHDLTLYLIIVEEKVPFELELICQLHHLKIQILDFSIKENQNNLNYESMEKLLIYGQQDLAKLEPPPPPSTKGDYFTQHMPAGVPMPCP